MTNYKMQTSKRLFPFFILFFGVALFITPLKAQESTGSGLIGVWVFNEQASFSKIRIESKQHMDSLPEVKRQFEASYRGRQLNFGSDGSYVVQLSDGRRALGTWTMEQDNIIRIQDPNGNITRQQLTRLTKTKLVFLPLVTGNFKSTITEFHFNKL